MSKKRNHVAAFLCLPAFALLGIFLLSNGAAAQQAGIGLDELRNLAGAANVDGTGVNYLHVELESDPDPNDDTEIRNYSPDPNNGQFSSKTFTDVGNVPSDGVNGHATLVGEQIYGSTFGIAPGLGNAGSPAINIHGAVDFLNNELRLSSGGTPVAQNYDVSSHSYVYSLNPAQGFDEAAAEELLQRLDFVINEGNMTTVVGLANSRNSDLPAGNAQAYNTINVGLSSGDHSSGPTTLYGPGRNPVHVTINRGFTSGATGIVGGAAAVLYQTGSATDAVKHEVIKATILAGATKDDLEDANGAPAVWSHSQTQPLDTVYGAGELNILNNHNIQQGGEFDGSTSDPVSPVGLSGWDYEPSLTTGEQRIYEFSVREGQKLNDLSVVLTWNINVEDSNPFPLPFSFTPATSLADLSLELFDSSTGFLAAVIDSSDSAIDNVEHIFISNLSAGTYHLRVTNKASGSFDTDFGLAFRSTAILLGDLDLSGGVDFFDITPLINLFTTGEYQVEADLNCDGVVNFFDISPFISVLSNN